METGENPNKRHEFWFFIDELWINDEAKFIEINAKIKEIGEQNDICLCHAVYHGARKG